MSNPLSKKILLSLIALSLCLTTGKVFANEISPDFTSYIRVKNITAGDNPDGSAYTMGNPGDEFRYLIAVHNQTGYEQDYTVNISIPTYLSYTPSSSATYQSDTWTIISDLTTTPYTLHAWPNQVVYLRFSTTLDTDLPNENLVLATASTITTTDLQTTQNNAKIYIPNFTQTPLTELYPDLTTEEITLATEILTTEEITMQEAINKIQNTPTNPTITPTPDTEPTTPSTTSTTETILITSLVSVLLLVLIYIFYNHYNEKDE